MTEWIAYSILEPFGTGHQEEMIGSLMATIGNYFLWAFGDPKKSKGKEFKASDFIPNRLEPPKPKEDTSKRRKQTVEEMKEILKSIAGKSK